MLRRLTAFVGIVPSDLAERPINADALRSSFTSVQNPAIEESGAAGYIFRRTPASPSSRSGVSR